MEILFVLILLLFFLIVGFLNFKHANRDLNSYVLANRSRDGFSVGLSLSAVIIGASATMGMAGLVYKMGIVGIWWLLSGVFGLLILYFFLSKKAHILGVMTLSEAMGKFYGEPARLISAFLIVIAWSGIVAAQLIAAGKLLSVVSNAFTFSEFVLYIGVFVILYAIVGGQYSVIRTDKIQFIILFFGFILTALFLVLNFSLHINKNLLSFPISHDFSIYKLLLFLLVVGLPYAVGPDMYSRIFAAKSPKHAQIGVLITIFTIIIVAFSIGIIGLYAHNLTQRPDKILIVMINKALPGLLAYIFIASILASVISSADTCLFDASAILALDILKARSVSSVRIIAIVVGIFSIIVALYFGEIIKTMLIAYGIYTGSVAVPLLFGFFNDRLKIKSQYVLFVMIVSAFVALYFSVIKDTYAGLISVLVSFGLMSVSFLLSRYNLNRVERFNKS